MTLTNPIWVVKTRLCLTNTANVPSYMHYKGLTDGLVNLFRYEGVRGLYKGYLPGLFGTSHGAIQFMVYEELKKAYCNYYHISITTKLVSRWCDWGKGKMHLCVRCMDRGTHLPEFEFRFSGSNVVTFPSRLHNIRHNVENCSAISYTVLFPIYCRVHWSTYLWLLLAS